MLDFIRDIFASFRQSSLERVRSPFLGAFVFSWLGFNWPILAILFFSNREIEKRLVYITDNFGIESYLIGPLCTSALIAYLLPKINKLVTKIQDKPNTETIEMSLESKIRIAKKQQEIAEIDARKKLAEKKEERNIEEGIANIKLEIEKNEGLLKIRAQEIQALSKETHDLNAKVAIAESKYRNETQAKDQLIKELEAEKVRTKTLEEKLLETTRNYLEEKSAISNLLDSNKNLIIKNKQLTDKIDRTEAYIDILAEDYPKIFIVKKDENAIEITVTNEASFNLAQINASIKLRPVAESIRN